jgi:hypothetical protein
LAALEVDRKVKAYYPGGRRDTEHALRTIEVPDFIPMAALCEALQITPARLRPYNLTWMLSVWSGEKHMPAGYALRLPPKTMNRSAAAHAIAAIPLAPRFAAQVPDEVHVVSSDTTIRCPISPCVRAS